MFYCVHLLIVKGEAIQSLVYFIESQNINVRVLEGILAITLPAHFKIWELSMPNRGIKYTFAQGQTRV